MAVDLSFSAIESTLSSRFTEAYSQINDISEVSIRNVLLTNKIINLLFAPLEESWCSAHEQAISDSGETDGISRIWLSTQSDDAVYQVFVMDEDGQLESAFDSVEYPYSIEVKKPNSSYLIFYNYKGKRSFDLRRPNNLYLTLDLEIVGNIDDATEKA